MICKVCGRNIENDDVNYCSYCGYSFRQEANGYAQEHMYASVDGSNNYGNHSVQSEQDKEEPIGFGNWMGTLLLPLIPGIGFLIYMVMLFVWSFSSETKKTKKNWARAQLIVLVVGIIMLASIISPMVINILNSPDFVNPYI